MKIPALPPVVKTWGTRFIKNGVIAAVMALEPILHDPKDYNITSLQGDLHVGGLIVAAVAARELVFFVFPLLSKLLEWAQSND